MMRKLCPNLDREDGLDTVLEVPIPEETFASYTHSKNTTWQNMMKSWIKPQAERSLQQPPPPVFGACNTEIQLLLGVGGAPLIPLPIRSNQTANRNINDHCIESSMAKYIVQQYIAASGGEKALNSIDSMYAMGKVQMVASEFINGDCSSMNYKGQSNSTNKVMKMKNRTGVMGGFVLWQKRPELWCLELMVFGCKISAGSDGKVAWRQTPWHDSHASRGPPRPLRRCLQGLDPRSTANLFSSSICVGEKTINNEDCFVLRLEAESSTLRARSSSNVEVIRHTVWGYFSQRTGLLLQLKDSQLIRISGSGNDIVFWETTMESLIQAYRTTDGINIAHSGGTSVFLTRIGEGSDGHSRMRMEEAWTIEEVDFNIKGLSMDCFLSPADLKIEEERGPADVTSNVPTSNARLPLKFWINPAKVGVAKVVAIDEDYLADSEKD